MNHQSRPLVRVPAVALLASFALACSADGPADVASASDAIIGGQVARDYPEAVLVDSDRGYCSGALIAPRVVLTAGHCVKGASRWTVTAPYARGQSASTTTAWTTYTAHSGIINPRSIDVAVLVLDSPIELEYYPAFATEPVRNATRAFNVGRVRNGATSRTALYFGPEVSLGRGQQYGYPYSYVSDEVVESGDSGGPTYVKTSEGRTIVAVASGAASGKQVLARVDLVKDDIARLVAESE